METITPADHEPNCPFVRNPDALCRCDLTGKSKVGDWIWKQLHRGRSVEEIAFELRCYTEELAARMEQYGDGGRYQR